METHHPVMGTHHPVMETHDPLMETHYHLCKPFLNNKELSFVGTIFEKQGIEKNKLCLWCLICSKIFQIFLVSTAYNCALKKIFKENSKFWLKTTFQIFKQNYHVMETHNPVMETHHSVMETHHPFMENHNHSTMTESRFPQMVS